MIDQFKKRILFRIISGKIPEIDLWISDGYFIQISQWKIFTVFQKIYCLLLRFSFVLVVSIETIFFWITQNIQFVFEASLSSLFRLMIATTYFFFFFLEIVQRRKRKKNSRKRLQEFPMETFLLISLSLSLSLSLSFFGW